MLSSDSVQKFPSGKKTKKKYQKFNNCLVNNIATSGKIENENSRSVWKSDMNVEKNSNRSIDLKDFPELKVLKKHNSKSSYECDSNEKLTSGLTRNQKKSTEAFRVLLVTNNHKIGDGSLGKKEENLSKIMVEGSPSGLSKTYPEVRFEKQVNIKINSKEGNKDSSSKKSSVQPQMSIKKKKRADPILINFQDILTFNNVQKKRKQYKPLKNKVQRLRHKEFLSGNFLDSSNPKRSRGKYREIKKKKLSTFKTNIIKERIVKQKMKEMASDTNIENVYYNLIHKIDFKSEIKIYLNKLNEKKIKNVENNQNKMRECTQLKNNDEEKQKNLETKLIDKAEDNLINGSSVKEKKIPQVVLQGKIKFSSKFREYCDNIVTPDLNSAVTELIKELIKLQDRLFSKDPIKAKVKKRHVSGIREVRKYLTLKKVKMIIIAPNLEKLQMEGSVYDSINELKSMANTQNVIYGFALDRYKLGRCTKKNVPVSAFAILNYEGLEDLYRNAVHKLQEAKKIFSELTKPEKIVENAEKTEEVNSKIISSLISAFREDLRVSKKAESQPD